MKASRPLTALTALCVAGTMSMAGCAPQYASPQQAAANACSALGPKALSGALIGGLGGAASGAALGAAAGRGRGAAVGAGVGLLAGIIGGLAVGNSLDQRDCQQAQIALAQIGSVPTGNAITWSSPSGSSGSYVPTGAVYLAADGRSCRPIRQTAALQNRAPVQDTAIVCRNDQGDWYVAPT